MRSVNGKCVVACIESRSIHCPSYLGSSPPLIPNTDQVQLTADYAPSKLMDLLTASQFYPLEAALSICQVGNGMLLPFEMSCS